MAHSESMFFGSLLISGWNWLVPAGVFLFVALLVLFWGYRRAPAVGWVPFACFTLKLLGLVALLLCLLEPLWSGQRARPGANYFAIVADNSQGMNIKDPGATRTRGELLRQSLTTDQHSWQGKLEETFQVRRYVFDSRLQFTKNFSEMAFDGRASSIGSALRAVEDRYRGQPLAGVLLFTDGNATDLTEGTGQFSGLPPIYPVVIGSDAAVTDIALQKVTVTQTAFEDAPVSVQADVTSDGFFGSELVAQLIEFRPGTDWTSGSSTFRNGGSGANTGAVAQTSGKVDAGNAIPGKTVAEQTQKVRRDGETMAFRFQVRPEKSGITFYRVRVSAKNQLDQFTNPELSKEATLANNTRVVAVDRGKGPYRVLYIAGRPNWEYKFLHRAIDEDDQVQLSALIRIARREPKMDFRGRAGESSNPLFRGFGNQSKEETEQYDQPVVRALTPNEDEFAHLRDGFPKKIEELYRYQAIILDDLEADFFTHDQMVMLQKFVSERGGGFLMLGGQESFYEGKFERTPVGEMLPVYLHSATESSPTNGYRLNLTREGWLQPWARLRNNEADEDKRLAETPPFQVLNQIREFKPGASAIATVSDASGKNYPALVVQRFGSGRTAALMIGDIWHWGLRNKEAHRDMDKAWRQLTRWLISDVPNRIELVAEQRTSDADQAVLLQIKVRDEKFMPMDNASVTVFVSSLNSPGGQTINPGDTNSAKAVVATSQPVRLTAEPSLAEPGLYQTTYVPRQTGGYFAEAIVTNSVGAEIGRAQAGWSSDPAAEEFRSLKPNRALLEEIAKKTGGQVIPIDQLDGFVRGLPERKVPITENWTFPLWHQPTVFLLALSCFILEWGLRRWKGLA